MVGRKRDEEVEEGKKEWEARTEVKDGRVLVRGCEQAVRICVRGEERVCEGGEAGWDEGMGEREGLGDDGLDFSPERVRVSRVERTRTEESASSSLGTETAELELMMEMSAEESGRTCCDGSIEISSASGSGEREIRSDGRDELTEIGLLEVDLVDRGAGTGERIDFVADREGRT
jgi:hypothetical protein